MDIIKWPTVLQEQCFASERAKIEAPYRRTPPKLSVPTPADYRKMAGTVEDMKAVLEWRLKEGVDTADYNAAKTFLDQLGQEVATGPRPQCGRQFELIPSRILVHGAFNMQRLIGTLSAVLLVA